MIFLWICSFLVWRLFDFCCYVCDNPQYDDKPFHCKCNVLTVIMESDKANVAKKGGEDPGLPPASREGENCHEPRRQRSLNG